MGINKSALVVDDEGHLRVILRRLLKRLGIEAIYEAANGKEACLLYGEHRPQLVLMDVNMPGMNGLETLREIRALDPDAAVVMLTSVTSRKAVEESAESGASHFIRKDTPLPEMEAILRSVLESVLGQEEPSHE